MSPSDGRGGSGCLPGSSDLALAAKAQGDLARAAGHLQEGLALAAKTGDQTSAAYYLEALAAIAGQ